MPVAIVTGSSRGIGRAIALRLASDGFKVVVTDIESQKAATEEVVKDIVATGREAHSISADVSIQEQVESMVAETVEVYGELNVMISNAGILDLRGVLDISVEQWDRVMATNVRGVFLCHSAAARQMIRQGKGGKLVAACSLSGYRPSGNCPAYCTSKWAVRGFTQSCAIELGQYGITVNAYCPGTVPNTNMSSQYAVKLSKIQAAEDQSDSNQSKRARGNALNVELEAEDIAGLVSFLASKDSDRITGQSILCDGGVFFS